MHRVWTLLPWSVLPRGVVGVPSPAAPAAAPTVFPPLTLIVRTTPASAAPTAMSRGRWLPRVVALIRVLRPPVCCIHVCIPTTAATPAHTAAYRMDAAAIGRLAGPVVPGCCCWPALLFERWPGCLVVANRRRSNARLVVKPSRRVLLWWWWWPIHARHVPSGLAVFIITSL